MVRHSFEGTWEEITRHAAELAGRRVRLTVLEEASNGGSSAPGAPSGNPVKHNGGSKTPADAEQTLDKALAGYVGMIDSGAPHNDSRRVKEIFGTHVLEQHRKRQERRK